MDNLAQKLKEAEDMLAKIEAQIVDLHNTKMQLVGRLQTYREFLSEQLQTKEKNTEDT